MPSKRQCREFTIRVMKKSSRVFLWVVVALSLLLTSAYSQSRSDFAIEGPIAADEPGTSRNAIYSASAIELEANGYLEEEYFIEGLANRYTRPKNETGAIIDSGHPHRTRLIVRWPRSASSFGVLNSMGIKHPSCRRELRLDLMSQKKTFDSIELKVSQKFELTIP